MINVELIERFHEKWEKSETADCWEWTAAVMGRGYGFIKIPGTRKHVSAHRLSYLIHYGEIPEGMMVCHTCDNTRCVKPSHLFLGTCKDNLQDMKAKDRHLRGARNKRAKLNDDKVRQIHRLLQEGKSQGSIARLYGVAQSTVHRISKGRDWNHIYREIYAGQE